MTRRKDVYQLADLSNITELQKTTVCELSKTTQPRQHYTPVANQCVATSSIEHDKLRWMHICKSLNLLPKNLGNSSNSSSNANVRCVMESAI